MGKRLDSLQGGIQGQSTKVDALLREVKGANFTTQIINKLLSTIKSATPMAPTVFLTATNKPILSVAARERQMSKLERDHNQFLRSIGGRIRKIVKGHGKPPGFRQ